MKKKLISFFVLIFSKIVRKTKGTEENFSPIFLHYGVFPMEKHVAFFLIPLLQKEKEDVVKTKNDLSYLWKANSSTVYSKISSMRADLASAFKKAAYEVWEVASKKDIPDTFAESPQWPLFLQKVGVTDLVKEKRIVAWALTVVFVSYTKFCKFQGEAHG